MMTDLPADLTDLARLLVTLPWWRDALALALRDTPEPQRCVDCVHFMCHGRCTGSTGGCTGSLSATRACPARACCGAR